MDNSVRMSILLQIYGKLLTEKQYELLDDYYNNDLSLSEIAENHGITRQAVRDNLKKGENNLFEYEEKLKFVQANEELEKKIDNIEKDLMEVEKIVSQDVKLQIIKIKSDLKNLI